MADSQSQYDAIGRFYEAYAEKAALKRAEAHTVFGHLGDIKGKAILDVACGFGFYTRTMMSRGASRALGVDVSSEMIEIARHRERADPIGTEYLVCDCAHLPTLGEFDIVSAVYLFDYATSKEVMKDMFLGMRKNLKPDCPLIAYTVNPGFDLHRNSFTKYGITVFSEERIDGGYKAKGEFVTDPPTPIEAFRWDAGVYEWAAEQAGLKQFKWHPIEVPEVEVERYGEDFWGDFRSNCIAIGFSCFA